MHDPHIDTTAEWYVHKDLCNTPAYQSQEVRPTAPDSSAGGREISARALRVVRKTAEHSGAAARGIGLGPASDRAYPVRGWSRAPKIRPLLLRTLKRTLLHFSSGDIHTHWHARARARTHTHTHTHTQVRVSANVKAQTVEELLDRRRALHLAGFAYANAETARTLARLADEGRAEERLLQSDRSAAVTYKNGFDSAARRRSSKRLKECVVADGSITFTVVGLLRYLAQGCEAACARHKEAGTRSFATPNTATRNDAEYRDSERRGIPRDVTRREK